MTNNATLTYDNIARLIASRNPEMEGWKLKRIREEGRYLTDFPGVPVKFTVSVGGQSIGFSLHYVDLQKVWKIDIMDAFEKVILGDSTLLPGEDALNGIRPIYSKPGDEGEIVRAPLAIAGLFMTEPLRRGFAKGVEHSVNAFSRDENGVCPCSILFFESAETASYYRDGMNPEKRIPAVKINEMDYEYKVII